MHNKSQRIVYICFSNRECIKPMYDVLEARRIKPVFSFILPRKERNVVGDVEVINSRDVRMFAQNENVFIARNSSFY